jgi:methylmalonyl-CoA/ethylmalonyl-CoA epimerase
MLNRIYHLGYAVEDIEAASRFYSENFGVEPGEAEVVEEQGVVATMFWVGESMIELVQPTRPDSPVGRFLERRGEGVHHVAYEVEDLEAVLRELKRSGVELVDEEPRVGAGGGPA